MRLFGPAWLSSLRQYLPALPQQCVLCHAWPQHDVLCNDCWQRFVRPPLRCMCCALSLAGIDQQHPCCGHCLLHPPAWSRAYAWADYQYPWQPLIQRWKFHQHPSWARHFARWLHEEPAVQQLLAISDWVIPIPASPERLRERGYNPAAQLARALSPQRHALHSLHRTRHTPAQSELPRAERLRNVKGAFAVAPNHAGLLQGTRVLLVDDVMTTGATLTAATHTLLGAGVAQVNVLCIARTP